MSLQERINLVQKKFSVSIPYERAWRSKKSANKLIFGNVEERHSYVPA